MPEIIQSDERLKKLYADVDEIQNEIGILTASAARRRAEFEQKRKELGLKRGSIGPSDAAMSKGKLQALEARLAGAQARIREIKTAVLREKIDGLFREFRYLDNQNLESLKQVGVMLKGKKFPSQTLGELEPTMAMSMAKAFINKDDPAIMDVAPFLDSYPRDFFNA